MRSLSLSSSFSLDSAVGRMAAKPRPSPLFGAALTAMDDNDGGPQGPEHSGPKAVRCGVSHESVHGARRAAGDGRGDGRAEPLVEVGEHGRRAVVGALRVWVVARPE